jgi:rhodanese-related sulfurtransferase
MFSFFQNNNKQTKDVSVEQAFQMISDVSASALDLILIDVREKGEYDSGHAQGAVNYPLSTLSSDSNIVKDLQKYNQVLIICQSGGRSSRAAEFLKSKDVNVLNVTGGTSAWVLKNLPYGGNF